MVQWHTKSNKLKTGGKRSTVNRCDKKKAWMGGTAANTKTDADAKETRNVKSGRGNSSKIRVTQTKYANVVLDKKTNKMVKAEIIAVKENNANRLFARSNISTKGATIKVMVDGSEKTAKITSRPGQDGIVNAVLIE